MALAWPGPPGMRHLGHLPLLSCWAFTDPDQSLCVSENVGSAQHRARHQEMTGRWGRESLFSTWEWQVTSGWLTDLNPTPRDRLCSISVLSYPLQPPLRRNRAANKCETLCLLGLLFKASPLTSRWPLGLSVDLSGLQFLSL